MPRGYKTPYRRVWDSGGRDESRPGKDNALMRMTLKLLFILCAVLSAMPVEALEWSPDGRYAGIIRLRKRSLIELRY